MERSPTRAGCKSPFGSATYGSSCERKKRGASPVGFQVHTLSEVNVFGTLQNSPGIEVVGDYQHDVPAPPQGFITHFDQTTDSNGFTAVPSGKAPGVWNLGEKNGPCGGQATFV